MKYELMTMFKTDKRPLNFVAIPTIWYYSDCKNRTPWRSLTFAWLWWQFTIQLDAEKI
jgi:hypothetical protein